MTKVKKDEILEEIKTELTEEELKKMYGDIPAIPEEIPTKPETHEENENKISKSE